MHRVERSVLVPYSTEEMFGLVAGVKDYPKFLPWCAGARLRPQPNGDIEATVQIDYRGVRSEFTTLNHNDAPRLIRMQLVAGPFRRLSGEWTFTQLRDDACKVHLNLHFQFATGIVGRAVAPVFEGIAGSMIDAFTRRAEAVFGMR
ncbi:MAG: type II toxin-antitoxin system RatA family toxin [Betaproteobacteria bacterium]